MRTKFLYLGLVIACVLISILGIRRQMRFHAQEDAAWADLVTRIRHMEAQYSK